MNALVALIAVATATAAVPAVSTAQAEEIEIPGAELRVGDLAALDGFAAMARSPQRSRTLAALPSGRGRFVTSRGALAALVARRFGAIVPQVERADGRVVIRRAASVSVAARCFAASSPIAAGTALAPADLAPTPCAAGESPRALRFDRTSAALRAVGRIEEGTYLGRVALPDDGGIAAGDELTLVSTFGPVRISRPVSALQPGRAGRRLFVRDRDGMVFSVPVAADPAGAR